MLSGPPAPARAPAGPDVDSPRISSGRVAVEVPDELAELVQHLARARGHPLESLTADLLRRGLEQESRRRRAEDALAGLTPRQREVARLAAGGQTNRQIARELWLSPETVKTHLRRTLEHFDLHSKAELRLLLLDLDGVPSPGSATKRDPLQGAKRDPLQGAKRDPLQGAKRETRLAGD
jgi:DNA-binding CsgD family transcriptional regulator